ncbi:ran binding protein in the microtubule-organising centre [Ceratocystis lukuohia]|uniref:Ran binding protein in the microtubule-organising centre n=1 Tax=Ceratocystis lukuohia TaxID=2019550 RepID=A0ABR4MBL3_9PEZI
MILDYLTREGYADAAAKFCREADLDPQQPTEMIQERRDIQQAIRSGRVQHAIEALNDLNPELIEMIRDCSRKGDDPGCFLPAVQFAQENLASRAVEDPSLLKSLEKAMSLIVFPQAELTCELTSLLDPRLRQEVADSVNKAILSHQDKRGETVIRYLLGMRAWSQKMAENSDIKLPESLQSGLDVK